MAQVQLDLGVIIQRRKLRRLRASNFKSFKSLDVTFGDFTVIVGGNATGKSSLVEAARFLCDVAENGLEDAFGMHGGIDYVRNVVIGQDQPLKLGVEFEIDFERPVVLVPKTLSKKTSKEDTRAAQKQAALRITRLEYSLTIAFGKRGPGYNIREDRLIAIGTFVATDSKSNKENLGQGSIICELTERGPKWKMDFSGDFRLADEETRWFENMSAHAGASEIYKPPIIHQPVLLFPGLFPLFSMQALFDGMAFFDFDPKLPKQSATITGPARLEEDGQNLAIVLRPIIQSKAKYKKLRSLLKELLPFVDQVSVRKLEDKSFLITLKEAHNRDYAMPSTLLSDGTIHATALLVALYFDEAFFAVVEEPERNLHPKIIEKLMALMKERAAEKQLLITTHNPEVLAHINLDSILLVRRGKEGFSEVQRPADSAEVKQFVKDEIGISALFVQGLLD